MNSLPEVYQPELPDEFTPLAPFLRSASITQDGIYELNFRFPADLFVDFNFDKARSYFAEVKFEYETVVGFHRNEQFIHITCIGHK